MQQKLPFGEASAKAPELTEGEIEKNKEVIQAYLALALQIYIRLKDEGKEIKK